MTAPIGALSPEVWIVGVVVGAAVIWFVWVWVAGKAPGSKPGAGWRDLILAAVALVLMVGAGLIVVALDVAEQAARMDHHFNEELSTGSVTKVTTSQPSSQEKL